MKNLLLTISLLISISAFSQEAFDENKEGFDNLPKGTLRKEIACFSSWGESEKNNSLKPGKTIITAGSKNSMTFKRENVTVVLRIKPFDKSKYTIKRDKDGHIVALNNKHVFGRDYDNEPPSTVMQSVMVVIGTDSVRLPPAACENLFQPRICEPGGARETKDSCPKIFISDDKKRIYIFSWHSDGAGFYEVTWIIQDKKYLRRVVDFGY